LIELSQTYNNCILTPSNAIFGLRLQTSIASALTQQARLQTYAPMNRPFARQLMFGLLLTRNNLVSLWHKENSET